MSSMKPRTVSTVKPRVTASTSRKTSSTSKPLDVLNSGPKGKSDVSHLNHSDLESRLKDKTQGSEKEDHQNEEATDEIVDDSYNSYVTSSALNSLISKARHRMRGDIDKQISVLQKRVKDDLDALEETKSKVNSLNLLMVQTDLLSFYEGFTKSFTEEPALTKGKSFGELMSDIDNIKNHLPCKNVSIPETSSQIVDFQNSASQLLHSLERISTVYGSDQTPISQTAGKLHELKVAQDSLENNKYSIEGVSLKACSSVLNEAITKTSNLNTTLKEF